MRWAPRIDYGVTTVQLTLAQKWWQPSHGVGYGDSSIADSGVPCSYVVRWDEKVEVTLRFTEEERQAVVDAVVWMQQNRGSSFTYRFEAGGTSYTMYLVSPATGERINPRRHKDDHEVWELTIKMRSATGTRIHVPIMTEA